MLANKLSYSLIRMKSSQLFVTSIAISVSCSIPSVVESFSVTSIYQQQLSGNFRCVHLPTTTSSLFDSASADDDSSSSSVTGPIYEMDGDDIPTVKLFTKHGCTLCDKVKDVLESVRDDHPHSLYAVDITDDDKEQWFAKYKYDIPVLHINDVYWTKHRLSSEDAIAGIIEACSRDFTSRKGEPDASRLEN